MKNFLLLLALLVSLIAVSCSGSNSPTTDLQVTLTDFMFSPNQFTVPAGKEITLEIGNSGAVVHNFLIMNAGQDVGTEYTANDDANVYWKVELPAGGSTSTTFTAPSVPGEYQVVCSTPGHLQAGMVATLIVVADE